MEGASLNYQAVVFDLDGTLLYTLEDLWRATNHGLSSCGLPPRTIEEVRRFVGNGYRQLARLASPDGTPDAVQEQVLAAFNAHYAAHAHDNTVPYPGIESLLGRLKAAGLHMAVVSNKGDAAVQDLMARQFPGIFEAVAGERADVRRKPAPDTVFAVLDQMGVTATQAAYVGDSEVDVATAANAGCDCIACTWGYRSAGELRSAGATILVDNAAELGRLLLGRE